MAAIQFLIRLLHPVAVEVALAGQLEQEKQVLPVVVAVTMVEPAAQEILHQHHPHKVIMVELQAQPIMAVEAAAVHLPLEEQRPELALEVLVARERPQQLQVHLSPMLAAGVELPMLLVAQVAQVVEGRVVLTWVRLLLELPIQVVVAVAVMVLPVLQKLAVAA
jgi:hypothetical protein